VLAFLLSVSAAAVAAAADALDVSIDGALSVVSGGGGVASHRRRSHSRASPCSLHEEESTRDYADQTTHEHNNEQQQEVVASAVGVAAAAQLTSPVAASTVHRRQSLGRSASLLLVAPSLPLTPVPASPINDRRECEATTDNANHLARTAHASPRPPIAIAAPELLSSPVSAAAAAVVAMRLGLESPTPMVAAAAAATEAAPTAKTAVSFLATLSPVPTVEISEAPAAHDERSSSSIASTQQPQLLTPMRASIAQDEAVAAAIAAARVAAAALEAALRDDDDGDNVETEQTNISGSVPAVKRLSAFSPVQHDGVLSSTVLSPIAPAAVSAVRDPYATTLSTAVPASASVVATPSYIDQELFASLFAPVSAFAAPVSADAPLEHSSPALLPAECAMIDVAVAAESECVTALTPSDAPVATELIFAPDGDSSSSGDAVPEAPAGVPVVESLFAPADAEADDEVLQVAYGSSALQLASVQPLLSAATMAAPAATTAMAVPAGSLGGLSGLSAAEMALLSEDDCFDFGDSAAAGYDALLFATPSPSPPLGTGNAGEEDGLPARPPPPPVPTPSPRQKNSRGLTMVWADAMDDVSPALEEGEGVAASVADAAGDAGAAAAIPAAPRRAAHKRSLTDSFNYAHEPRFVVFQSRGSNGAVGNSDDDEQSQAAARGTQSGSNAGSAMQAAASPTPAVIASTAVSSAASAAVALEHELSVSVSVLRRSRRRSSSNFHAIVASAADDDASAATTATSVVATAPAFVIGRSRRRSSARFQPLSPPEEDKEVAAVAEVPAASLLHSIAASVSIAPVTPVVLFSAPAMAAPVLRSILKPLSHPILLHPSPVKVVPRRSNRRGAPAQAEEAIVGGSSSMSSPSVAPATPAPSSSFAVWSDSQQVLHASAVAAVPVAASAPDAAAVDPEAPVVAACSVALGRKGKKQRTSASANASANTGNDASLRALQDMSNRPRAQQRV
jgi:hypothetical protein